MKYLSVLSIFCLLHLGCSNSEGKKINDAAGEMKIEVVTEKELNDIISERNGKLLFLNVWATWCVPCVEEFPAIVKLYNNYKAKDVEVIALSVDLPSEVNDKIIPFLKKQEAEFPVYVALEKSSDEIIEMLNKDWSGAVPASLIYDKAGRLVKFLTGAHTYNQFASSIDSVKAM